MIVQTLIYLDVTPSLQYVVIPSGDRAIRNVLVFGTARRGQIFC